MIPISISAGTFSYNAAILNTTFTLIPFQLIQTVCPSVNVRGRFLEEYVQKSLSCFYGPLISCALLCSTN